MQLQRPSKSDERQIWLAIKHHLANLLRSCCFMLTLQLTFIVLFLHQNCTHVNFIHIKHGQAKRFLHYSIQFYRYGTTHLKWKFFNMVDTIENLEWYFYVDLI